MGIKAAMDKKKREKELKVKFETAKKVAAGAAVGAAVGAAAGILLAPKSGEELRNDISAGAEKAVGNVKGTIAVAKGKIMAKMENTCDCDCDCDCEEEVDICCDDCNECEVCPDCHDCDVKEEAADCEEETKEV